MLPCARAAFRFHYGLVLVRATATMIAATITINTAAPISSSDPDEPPKPGIDEEAPGEFGPELVDPMLTGIVVLCETEPLVSVMVTV